MDDEQLTTGEYARLLSWGITAYFWVMCLVLGYCIINDYKAAAILWLVILSSSLPVAVKASAGLVMERHFNNEFDAKEITSPIKAWVFVMVLVWISWVFWFVGGEVFTQYLAPHLYGS